tara:strand:+ start:289 stop:894 length:606 start_codon:yes stop_codon:yes gene_type:complete
MHQLNVLILGSNYFKATLNELKPFLKFNLLIDELNTNYDVILLNKFAIKDKKLNQIINQSKSLKVYASDKKNNSENYDAFLELPSTLKNINTVIESIAAKKIFNKNSSIIIKDYLLNKNEKKLFRENNYITLTEKEVQLLELFLNSTKPISKDKILISVWNYSSDADTHTVETHIYRLRKKINDKFGDEKFILNNKDGYSL